MGVHRGGDVCYERNLGVMFIISINLVIDYNIDN
jgi:hypothetical protein